MEKIYYFPSCSGGPISLIHSFTRFPLDIWKPGMGWGGGGGALTKKGNERFMWFRLLTIIQERIPLTLVDPTRVIEISAQIKPENRN